jgi:small subunit ribosomal protein S7
MPRRRRNTERPILADPKYGDQLVAKLIAVIMWDGKKSTAEKIVYSAFDQIAKKIGRNPVEIFHQAVENLKPQFEVRSRRVGGATYQVPMEVYPRRQISLALRWLRDAARARQGERTMIMRLAGEIIDAADKKGTAYKKREDVHRMAEANRAFAHYRW